MTQLHSVRIAFFIVIITAGVLVYFFGDSPSTKLASLIVSRSLYTDRFNADLEAALQIVTLGTVFESRWQINQYPKEDHLNVYVLQDGLRQRPQSFPYAMQRVFGNAAFIGPPNVVVIDGEFIDTFVQKRVTQPFINQLQGLGRKGTNLSEWRSHRTKMSLLWFVGHEVGHIVAGHSPAHFAADELEQSVIAHSISWKREVEADGFLAMQVMANEEATLGLNFLLVELGSNELTATLANGPAAGQNSGLPHWEERLKQAEQRKKERTMSHPEYRLRCARMLLLLAKDDEDRKARKELVHIILESDELEEELYEAVNQRYELAKKHRR